MLKRLLVPGLAFFTLLMLIVAGCTAAGPNQVVTPAPQTNQVTQEAPIQPIVKTEKQFGYIKNVYTKNGKNSLDLDAAEMLTGKDAEKAAFDDGQCSKEDYVTPGACAPNDYYIRNKDPKLTTLVIAQNVKIEITSLDGGTNFDFRGNLATQILTFAKFKDFFDKDYDKPPFILVTPYNLEIQNGEIVKISQQYLP